MGEKKGKITLVDMNVAQMFSRVCVPAKFCLVITAKRPYMGILLEQEIGVIGLLCADVSARVNEQTGGEALLELNLNDCSSFLDIITVYCH